MTHAEHKALFTAGLPATEAWLLELRGQAVDALRAVVEAHQTLENALDIAEVLVADINAVESRVDELRCAA